MPDFFEKWQQIYEKTGNYEYLCAENCAKVLTLGKMKHVSLLSRGYDSMDEYIREEVLLLQGVDYTVLEKVTGECASRVYNALMRQHLEPGTKEAFTGYRIDVSRLPT